MLRCRMRAVRGVPAATTTVNARRTLFGNWGKNDGQATASKLGESKLPFGAGFMPGALNLQSLKEMQQLLAKRSPAEQKALFDQFAALQKDLKSSPDGAGFLERLRKNAEAMARIIEEQKREDAAKGQGGSGAFETARTGMPSLDRAMRASASTQSSAPSTPTGRPTLDQLKKIDLGPEIEALFEELRTIRAKKNSYRDQYHAAQAALAKQQQEVDRLTEVERDVRGRLRKAEQEVMLLRAENVQLGESAKQVRELTRQQTQLEQALREARSATAADKAEGSPAFRALQQELQSKEAALRSLHRKVDRLRLRDPLLQFSLVCNDVTRLCARADETHSGAKVSALEQRGKAAAEAAFEALRTRYEARQQDAWTVTATEDGAAARAYVASVRYFLCSCVPLANYDALVTVASAAEAEGVRRCFVELGFDVSDTDALNASDSVDSTKAAGLNDGTRLFVTAPQGARTTPQEQQPLPGPYGHAMALYIASRPTSGAAMTAADADRLAIVSVQPLVSARLVQDKQRTNVTFETARASGPGGQATNVSETQVYARLEIDGLFAYTAEAQDSRSALSNRDAALTRLQTQRRQQYNEQLAKEYKAEEVYSGLVAQLGSQGVGSAQASDTVQRLVQEAIRSHSITSSEALLVHAMQRLREAAMQHPGSG